MMRPPMSTRLFIITTSLIWLTTMTVNAQEEDPVNEEDISQIVNAHTRSGNETGLNSIRAPGWVNGPNYRGMASLLWSCIFTLFASIYASLRLNVPRMNVSSGIRSSSKVLTALLALVFPEIMLSFAVEQFYRAYWLREALNELLEKSDSERKSRPYTLTFCFFVDMGGIYLRGENLSRVALLSSLGAAEMARRRNFIDIGSPWISFTSRTTYFTGPLITLQVLWMILNCAVRAGKGLDISLLEVYTLVGILVAIALSLFWHYKPDGPFVPHNLLAEGVNQEITATELMTELQQTSSLVAAPKNRPSGSGKQYKYPPPDSPLLTKPWLLSKNRLSCTRVTTLLMLAQSGLYLVAWNYPFLTRAEEILWKTASFYLIGVWILVGSLCKNDEWWGRMNSIVGFISRGKMGVENILDNVCLALGMILLVLWISAKTILFVVALTSLRQLSVGTFVMPSWLAMVPHI
ncbi:hypothetical protein MKZ38_006673 [Zalerion maritima]|uniref:Uncharacterized protein n=1 Tax=Zalerion maritima TaxID=339359 RepID=A0AAD5RWG1_9PEZI|nr:hypothetical protein MKZ38_006673 [Zalerion maritima]